MTDDPPCPSGFYCLNGLCVDSPGGGGSSGGGGGGGGSAGGGGGGGGGGIAGVDMSVPSGVDMSMPPADMTSGPPDLACFPYGHTCNGDTACCNQCCHGCNLFGDCAAIG